MKKSNTTDPIARRKQRTTRQRGSKAALCGILIGHAMILVGGMLVVRSLFGFLEENVTNAGEPPLAIFGMAGGLPFIIFGFFVHIGACRRFTGKLLSSPGVGAGPILFLGFALGAWWGVLSLPVLGLLWLIPTILTAIALLFLSISVFLRMRRSTKNDLLRRMINEGKIAAALITDIPAIEPSSAGLIGTITVRFTDMNGVHRWVQKIGQWKRQDLPQIGGIATVLYDPRQPENDAGIWVGPPGSTTVTDFTFWHS
ncbi:MULTISPECIES: hypothetical protein [unclassified Sphingobacterium]|uniref:hypothetical protein n=1 Tax=unclassified Sphingobacterium TaxID=2609468 RepID=UPI0025E49574|nr:MULTISPECIES: hypothetical protein [unclassified Sphingobacterium]